MFIMLLFQRISPGHHCMWHSDLLVQRGTRRWARVHWLPVVAAATLLHVDWSHLPQNSQRGSPPVSYPDSHSVFLIPRQCINSQSPRGLVRFCLQQHLWKLVHRMEIRNVLDAGRIQEENVSTSAIQHVWANFSTHEILPLVRVLRRVVFKDKSSSKH